MDPNDACGQKLPVGPVVPVPVPVEAVEGGSPVAGDWAAAADQPEAPVSPSRASETGHRRR